MYFWYISGIEKCIMLYALYLPRKMFVPSIYGSQIFCSSIFRITGHDHISALSVYPDKCPLLHTRRTLVLFPLLVEPATKAPLVFSRHPQVTKLNLLRLGGLPMFFSIHPLSIRTNTCRYVQFISFHLIYIFARNTRASQSPRKQIGFTCATNQKEPKRRSATVRYRERCTLLSRYVVCVCFKRLDRFRIIYKTVFYNELLVVYR